MESRISDNPIPPTTTAELKCEELNNAWRSYTSPAEPVFHESGRTRMRRWMLGAAYALKPERISVLPRLSLATAKYILGSRTTRDELAQEPRLHGALGFAGVSNELGVGTMLDRYRRGLFPICHIGPTKWWSPAQRAIIAPDELRIARSTRKILRQNRFHITFDEDFAAVMEACSMPRPGKTPLTWITPRIMHAFWALHVAGYAHSVETWDDGGRLVGGLYGLAIGGVFFGESRFAYSDNASKVGVAVLHHHLSHWGFGLRDAKWMSAHLSSLGFRPVERATFETLLKDQVNRPGRVGRWEVDDTLDTSTWQPKRDGIIGSSRHAGEFSASEFLKAWPPAKLTMESLAQLIEPLRTNGRYRRARLDVPQSARCLPGAARRAGSCNVRRSPEQRHGRDILAELPEH